MWQYSVFTVKSTWQEKCIQCIQKGQNKYLNMHFPFSQQEIERKVNCSLRKGNVLIFLWVKCSAPLGHTCRWHHQTLSFFCAEFSFGSPWVPLGLSAWFFMTSLKTWLCQACCRFTVIFPFSTGCWNDFFRQFKQFFCTFFVLSSYFDSWLCPRSHKHFQYFLPFVLPTHAPVSTHSSAGWAGFGNGGEMLSRVPHTSTIA